jgi:hypothetical protein
MPRLTPSQRHILNALERGKSLFGPRRLHRVGPHANDPGYLIVTGVVYIDGMSLVRVDGRALSGLLARGLVERHEERYGADLEHRRERYTRNGHA